MKTWRFSGTPHLRRPPPDASCGACRSRKRERSSGGTALRACKKKKKRARGCNCCRNAPPPVNVLHPRFFFFRRPFLVTATRRGVALPLTPRGAPGRCRIGCSSAVAKGFSATRTGVLFPYGYALQRRSTNNFRAVPSDPPPDVVDSPLSLSRVPRRRYRVPNRRCSLCSATSYRFFAKTVRGASRAVFALGNRDHVWFKKEGSWVHSGVDT